ncbi:MAG: hypothetical protein ABSB71_13250 [Candidatus Bathyarchaeia archaeon]|jgi:hypothetical protein
MNIIFIRLEQPLNKYTFKAPKIRKWVEEQCREKFTLNLFAGPTVLHGFPIITNDLNEAFPTSYHMDALDCVNMLKKEGVKVKRVLLDPPYSYRKSMELYQGKYNSRFKQLLDVLPEVLASDGWVITFGYQSSVMSRKRGFAIREICLISHGGAQHDTIATVEERINNLEVIS